MVVVFLEPEAKGCVQFFQGEALLEAGQESFADGSPGLLAEVFVLGPLGLGQHRTDDLVALEGFFSRISVFIGFSPGRGFGNRSGITVQEDPSITQ